ncbi:MAG: hypothetical protein JW994_08065 [Candidatus Omnitrophica bacterium]|nr:hypothetical protein [Candidatus Omnitrophota bacterium]
MRKIVTQIGSLPLENVGEAVAYSLRHDIPFLPELPKKGDAMLNYIKNPGNLSCLAEFKKHEYDTVKIQCVGPATLMLAGYEEHDAVLRITEHINVVINGLKAQDVILFLDEPALGQSGINYDEVWQLIFLFSSSKAKKELNAKLISGVHVCGNMDWDKLFNSNVEIISFDASQFDITKYPKYRSGKRIAWGVNEKKDVRDFRQGDLVTLPCGMGTKLYKPEDCEKMLVKLDKIAGDIDA